MGFFSAKAQCGVCGKEVGLNRWKIKQSDAWCCPSCLSKATKVNSSVSVNTVTIEELKKLIAPDVTEGFVPENREFRKKCNVCGFIFCYDEKDLKRNQDYAKMATRAALASTLSAVGGTRLDMHAQSAQSDRYSNKVVDYNKCPQCHSSDLKELTKEEMEAEQAKANSGAAVSTADELKKFKELLDLGAITQEEYDAKKKQILGL